jgi:hypothetical protein
MKFLKLLCAAAGAAVVLQLTGCAASATSQAMTVKPGSVATVNPKLKGAVKLGEVTGGKATNPMWTSQVDGASFKKALEDSLAISGYLATDPAQAKYAVSANLAELDQPFMGLTLDVKSSITYQLAGPGVTRDYPVKATGSATVSDAFMAVERLRLSNERSILENIKEFLNQLAKFSD